jgi:hypothetical protein
MNDLKISRRIFSALAIAMVAGLALPVNAQTTKFSDIGWPESANEKVSAKSVAWLKEKGWWPMQVAFQQARCRCKVSSFSIRSSN